MNRTLIHVLLLAAGGLLVEGRPLAAQSAVYVTGAGFAEIKQFDSVAYDPTILASDDDFSMDATGAGGGVRVGTLLHPRWSLELAVDAGSTTRKSLPNPYVGIQMASSSLRFPEISASTRFLTVSSIIGFHPPKIGRFHLGYLGGFSFVRGTLESEIPDFRILSVSSVAISSPSNLGRVIFPTAFPQPIVGSRTVKRFENSAGAILGFEAAIDLSTRLSAVPGVRAIVFSTGGQSVFLIRPEIGVRWSF